MTIRVFRVTISDHTAHFDDLDVATQFVRSEMRNGPFPIDREMTIESISMDEEDYRAICEAEDKDGWEDPR